MLTIVAERPFFFLYIQYGLGVNLYNLRLLDTEIRFSLAKDEEQAQMDTEVGSTTPESQQT